MFAGWNGIDDAWLPSCMLLEPVFRKSGCAESSCFCFWCSICCFIVVFKFFRSLVSFFNMDELFNLLALSWSIKSSFLPLKMANFFVNSSFRSAIAACFCWRSIFWFCCYLTSFCLISLNSDSLCAASTSISGSSFSMDTSSDSLNCSFWQI